MTNAVTERSIGPKPAKPGIGPRQPVTAIDSHPTFHQAARQSLTRSDWQQVIRERGMRNAHGQFIDPSTRPGERSAVPGKEPEVINLNMHPKFGPLLAKVITELKSKGHKDFYMQSGVRSHAKQEWLFRRYGIYDRHGNRIGETHKVAKPGTSAHEKGLADDFYYNGSDPAKFWHDFKVAVQNAGLRYVTGDPNHCEMINARQMIAEMRKKQPIDIAAKRPSGRPQKVAKLLMASGPAA